MCWSEKCCLCVRLDLGCLLIGVTTLILSSLISVAAIICLGADTDDLQKHQMMHHFLALVHLDVNQVSKELILGIMLFVAVLWLLSSVALLIGIKLNAPGCVLSYFAFGIFIAFFCFLSSLLLLLRGVWPIAFLLFGGLIIHIHFLIVVHTSYELQLRGKIMQSEEYCEEEILIQVNET